jgi:hypothetical protein
MTAVFHLHARPGADQMTWCAARGRRPDLGSRHREEIMDIRRFARYLATFALLPVLLSSWAVPARGVLMITFSGANPVTIRDTDPGQSPGDITFGLVTEQGYAVSGHLTSQTNVGFSEVKLASFQANYLPVAPGGPLTVTFQDTFAANVPIPPVIATDSITALFSNIYGSNQIGGLNSLTEGAFVNATFINPIMSSGNNGPITFSPPAGNFSGIVDGHGPAQIMMGGPPWTLEGSFSVTLGARAGLGNPGDSLTYSQDIRIEVPELDPGSLVGALALASGGLMVLTGRRKRAKAAD